MKKLNNKKGFTIVELVIVIAVIGILAGVLIPTFSGIIARAKESRSLQETKNTLSEYISQNSEAKDGLVFYYPTDSVAKTEEHKEYDVYLFANNGLNLLGHIKISDSSTEFTVSTEFEAYKAKIKVEGSKVKYEVEIGSYKYSGESTFDNSNDKTYGPAYIAKQNTCKVESTATSNNPTGNNAGAGEGNQGGAGENQGGNQDQGGNAGAGDGN